MDRAQGTLPWGILGAGRIARTFADVLCQPFPTFALIGPRTVAEFRSPLRALPLTLSPAELAWLEGEG